MKKSTSYYIFPLIIATLLTIIFLHPIISNFSTHLTSRADGIFISWTIYTVADYLTLGKNIFQMPIFYPFSNTLAYSDPFIPTAILSIPILKITQNIVSIHNFHLLFGTIIMYYASFLLAKQLKYSTIASHFTATIFTFSAIHLEYLVHLHTYLIAGIPLTFLFIFKWIKQNNWYWLFLTLISFLYQVTNAPMTGFFLIFALLSLLVDKKFRDTIKKNIWLVLYYIFLGTLFLIAVYHPYFLVSKEFQYTRSIRDVAHFAHSINIFTRLDIIIFYLVFLVFRFTVQKCCTSFTNSNKKSKYLCSTPLTTTSILIIIATGVILMLGPVIKISGETLKIFNIPIPLPYAILYYIVPGFKAFRASSRWIILLNFGLSLLIGKTITESKLNKYVTITILIGLISSQYYFHIKTFKIYSIPQKIPAIYSIINKRNEATLAEFPVFSWGMIDYAYLENDRLLYQTVHKKILYNGVSGFTPPIRETQWDTLWKKFPSEKSIKHLQNENIELLKIDYSLYQTMYENSFIYNQHSTLHPNKIKEKINILEQKQLIKLITCDDGNCLYKITY